MSYEAQMRLNNGLWIKFEGETHVELFKEWAAVIEVFSEEKCGMCGCTEIKPIVRTNKDEDDFMEFHCTKCFARLSFGQNKKGGGLFPIRKIVDSGPDKGKPCRTNGKYDNVHNGWTKYRGTPKPGQPPQEEAAF